MFCGCMLYEWKRALCWQLDVSTCFSLGVLCLKVSEKEIHKVMLSRMLGLGGIKCWLSTTKQQPMPGWGDVCMTAEYFTDLSITTHFFFFPNEATTIGLDNPCVLLGMGQLESTTTFPFPANNYETGVCAACTS